LHLELLVAISSRGNSFPQPVHVFINEVYQLRNYNATS
jgi:hypothetical protein